MKASVTRRLDGRRGWRVIVASLLLIAFTLQSYITQTHIHSVSPAAISKTLAGSHGKAPVDDSPMDCPFCQAVAHDGPFFLPGAPVLLLSAIWVELGAPFFSARVNAVVPAHNWQSRAPPHH